MDNKPGLGDLCPIDKIAVLSVCGVCLYFCARPSPPSGSANAILPNCVRQNPVVFPFHPHRAFAIRHGLSSKREKGR
jgi:hypothetical protein